MTEYPRLPDPPAPEPGQTVEQYGLAALAFIVREAVTVTCSPEQLDLALHVSPIASAVSVTGPKDDRQVDYRTATADAVADAKRLILQTQRIRAEIARETARMPQEARAGLDGATGRPQEAPDAPGDQDGPQDGPHGGARVPRQPYPLSPAPAARLPEPMFNF